MGSKLPSMVGGGRRTELAAQQQTLSWWPPSLGPQTLRCGPLASEQMETWPLWRLPSDPSLSPCTCSRPEVGDVGRQGVWGRCSGPPPFRPNTIENLLPLGCGPRKGVSHTDRHWPFCRAPVGRDYWASALWPHPAIPDRGLGDREPGPRLGTETPDPRIFPGVHRPSPLFRPPL